MSKNSVLLVWQILKSFKPMQIIRLLTGTRRREPEWVDLREPSAIERLAAVGDPKGETAKRVRRWDGHQERMKDVLGCVAAEADRRSDAAERLAGK